MFFLSVTVFQIAITVVMAVHFQSLFHFVKDFLVPVVQHIVCLCFECSICSTVCSILCCILEIFFVKVSFSFNLNE